MIFYRLDLISSTYVLHIFFLQYISISEKKIFKILKKQSSWSFDNHVIGIKYSTKKKC